MAYTGQVQPVAVVSGTVVQHTADVSGTVSAGSGGGAPIALDTTLTQSGMAADAKAVGDALAELEAKVNAEAEFLNDVNGEVV